MYFRYADQVSIGDEVLVERNNQLIPENITKISNVKMQGNTVVIP